MVVEHYRGAKVEFFFQRLEERQSIKAERLLIE
jgi:hypothetical protein